MSELNSISIGQFESIREYHNKYEGLIEKMDRCVIPSERLTNREKEAVFNKGLAQWMREEMIRLGEKKFLEKIEIISKIEEARKMNRKLSNEIPKKKKWCHLHKVATHNDSECFSKKKSYVSQIMDSRFTRKKTSLGIEN